MLQIHYEITVIATYAPPAIPAANIINNPHPQQAPLSNIVLDDDDLPPLGPN